MKLVVEKTNAKGTFAENHPLDLVIPGQGLKISQTYEEAYRLAVDLLCYLHSEDQVKSYRISTKAGSHLNAEVTKGW